MSRIGLIACSKTKLPITAPAAALYSSALFRKSMLAAIDVSDRVYILSALHGLIPPSRAVSPYNVTLKRMARLDKINWREMVAIQLADVVRPGDTTFLFAGEEYSRPVSALVEKLRARFIEPLGRASLGPRLSNLTRMNDEDSLCALYKSLKPHVRRLWQAQGRGRPLMTGPGPLKWPKRGIYLVLEPESERKTPSTPRIVRVGTHAVSAGSKTTLWHRLSTHRGTLDGRGSHRSSIFRSHVGQALMRNLPDHPWPSTWAQGQAAPADIRQKETTLEKLVSTYICEHRTLWLNVPDEAGPDSDRAYLERNLIGLLTRIGFLSPSRHRGWLGEMSPEWRIAATGLWNLDHVFRRPDPAFVDVFAEYVDITLGKRGEPPHSIAPRGWRKKQSKDWQSQLPLFSDGLV